jgi:hypothetical protein
VGFAVDKAALVQVSYEYSTDCSTLIIIIHRHPGLVQ